MKSVVQASSEQAVIATTDGNLIRPDDVSPVPSPEARAVTDHGKILLGGAWRLPASRKAN